MPVQHDVDLRSPTGRHQSRSRRWQLRSPQAPVRTALPNLQAQASYPRSFVPGRLVPQGDPLRVGRRWASSAAVDRCWAGRWATTFRLLTRENKAAGQVGHVLSGRDSPVDALSRGRFSMREVPVNYLPILPNVDQCTAEPQHVVVSESDRAQHPVVANWASRRRPQRRNCPTCPRRVVSQPVCAAARGLHSVDHEVALWVSDFVGAEDARTEAAPGTRTLRRGLCFAVR